MILFLAYVDQIPSRAVASSNVFSTPSVTSLMLQKARLNLQAVERNLMSHSNVPDINSSEYLEYLKRKYLI